MRGCELKYDGWYGHFVYCGHPHAGVRIEIYYGIRKQWQGQVTPHAGVRIEVSLMT